MSARRSIAIVSVAGRFPGAADVEALWQAVLAGRSASRDVPAGRWPVAPADVVRAQGVDTARSSRACLLDEFELDAPELQLPDELRGRLSRLSKLTLQVGAEAVRAAGLERLPRAKTGVILANIALPTEGASTLAQDVVLGPLDEAVLGRRLTSRPEPLDAYPGALPAGLLARALGLGGGSYTLDAACASSLYAIALACLELEAGRLDAVLAGGVSLPQPLYTQVGFSQLLALSPSGRCAPYDTSADGLVVGEGAGMVVLKRLADARAAGDRVLAVIRGVGLSNDVGGSLLSPEREGQLRAMRAAYDEAGWRPGEVQLIEGHGTGTARGDAVEVESLKGLWAGEAPEARCVLGSVKSNVGHLLTAAGAAGLAKVLKALEAGTLPPSANSTATSITPGLAGTPFRVLQAPEPWARPARGVRRAAVSGFGFGGINAHLLLEEPAAEEDGPVLSARSLEPEPIALVGLAAHVGRLDSLEAFGHAVLRGEAVVDERPTWRWSGRGDALTAPRGAWLEGFEFPLGRFKVPPKDVPTLLPQQALMLKVAAEALVDAGLVLKGPQLRLGVVVGLGLDLETTGFHLRWLVRERVRQYEAARAMPWSAEEREAWIAGVLASLSDPLDAQRTLGALGGIVPSRIAREFQLGGPSFAVSGEDVSGLRALEVATRLLQAQQVDAMLVGAVDLTGDLRAVVAGAAVRGFSRAGVARPFDARADGVTLGEGAVAVVARRLGEAQAAGERVYAVLRGLGVAGAPALSAESAAGLAIARALEAATAEAASVGLVVSGASGSPANDAAEARALARAFDVSPEAASGGRGVLPEVSSRGANGLTSVRAGVGNGVAPGLVTTGSHSASPAGELEASQPGSSSSSLTTAVTSTAAVTGFTGAASGLASVVHAALALREQVLPPLAGFEAPAEAVAWGSTRLHVAQAPALWLRNRVEGPRRALVTGSGLDGSSVAVVLDGVERVDRLASRPLGERSAALFLLRGEGAVRALAERAASWEGPLERLAAAWHRGQPADGPVTRAVVAADVGELRRLLELPARAAKRIDGKVAFVFPGSGNHYLGMGRGLALALPEVYRHLDAEVEHLAGHLKPADVVPYRRDWRSGWRDESHRALLAHPERVILSQVAHGIAVSDAVRLFGVRPRATIGYSLGESVGLFASRAWRARDVMFSRIEGSPLFKTELSAENRVVRAAWGERAEWHVVIVNREAALVRKALRGTAALLIVNAPSECVVGGDRPDVEATVKALGCEALALESVPTVHLPVMAPARDAYHALHVLPCTPEAGVRYYSCGFATPYEPTPEACADSIVQNALHGFDFPALIRHAYDDGYRIFVELGPQGSCTRMISRILFGQPHLAVTACQRGLDGFRALLLAIGRLAEAGVEVSLEHLYGPEGGIELDAKPRPPAVHVVMGGQRPALPPLPSAPRAAGREASRGPLDLVQGARGSAAALGWRTPQGARLAAGGSGAALGLGAPQGAGGSLDLTAPRGAGLASAAPDLAPQGARGSAAVPRGAGPASASLDLAALQVARGSAAALDLPSPQGAGTAPTAGPTPQFVRGPGTALQLPAHGAGLAAGGPVALGLPASEGPALGSHGSATTLDLRTSGLASRGSVAALGPARLTSTTPLASHGVAGQLHLPARPLPPSALAPAMHDALQQLLATTRATADAHARFLEASRQNFELQLAILSGAPSTSSPKPAAPPAVVVPSRVEDGVVPRAFDRDACLRFAVGSLSSVLGSSFAAVDAYPTRVRLPAEPLMLVDRIVEVEGTPGSLSKGRCVTEHDVLPGAWYLDGGRAPTCISVEAGQADLFLSGYLGIDLRTKGEKVYRLLDAKIVMHRDLPRVGETIRYDIKIDRFICQGDTWLFFFRFDGTIDGAPFITMYDGCAGFFSPEQLASGKGIVDRRAPPPAPRRLDTSTGQAAAEYTPLLPLAPCTLDDAQVEALRTGDLARAFGPAFAGKTLAPALRLPTGRMRLVDRILELDPRGGAAGLGLVVGEHDVHADAWYLTCHFIDDQVMPGTLMYECCLHTLRCLLLRLGWVVADGAEVHAAPIEGVASALKCRGQVTAQTQKVTYRVELVEVGYDPEPYVIATASMYADGRHVVQMENMSLKLRGVTRAALEASWSSGALQPAPTAPPRFSRPQIVAYAEGNPSECFGEPYRPFDAGPRTLARLPRDPFLFVDRVLSIDAPPWKVTPGGWAECEFDVHPDAWYFAANRQGTMPFSVLLEAALQPCGFLAAYVGSALLSNESLHFRNLDGTATQHAEVFPDAGTLTTRARLTKTSQAGGMVLQEFDFEVRQRGAPVYTGHTGFGFFPAAALAAQVGVRGATLRAPGAAVRATSLPLMAPLTAGEAVSVQGPFGLELPARAYAMVDTLEVLELTGGAAGLGFVQASKRVDPAEWFFRAHFYQDPVMPGSLGLEAFVQALKLYVRERFGALASTHRFESAALGLAHTWQYRGQVVPANAKVTVQAEVTKVVDGPSPWLLADGKLAVDGKVIYAMKGFGLRLVPDASKVDP